MKIYLASSNAGKLRDFAAATAPLAVEMQLLPDFKSLTEAVEDGVTFEANARIKSEHYSRFAPGALVVADDSGLAVDALDGAPGVYSARYAAEPGSIGNSDDEANNNKLIAALTDVADESRTGRYVCVLSVARDGRELAHFRGEVEGRILRERTGSMGFGYDPLFFYPPLGRSFGQIPHEERIGISHRDAALQKFVAWYEAQSNI